MKKLLLMFFLMEFMSWSGGFDAEDNTIYYKHGYDSDTISIEDDSFKSDEDDRVSEADEKYILYLKAKLQALKLREQERMQSKEPLEPPKITKLVE